MRRLVRNYTGTILLAGFILTSSVFAQVKVDPKLPEYRPTTGVSGTIKSVGSDTMNNLMTLWAEGFKKTYPNIQVEIEGKGSSTAPPALIGGTAQFGPMSREMKMPRSMTSRKPTAMPPPPCPAASTCWPSTSTRTTRSRD